MCLLNIKGVPRCTSIGIGAMMNMLVGANADADADPDADADADADANDWVTT